MVKKAVKKKAVAKKKVAVKKAVAKKKVSAKKAVTKKAVVKKKASVKKAVVAPKVIKGTRTAYTKTELVNSLVESTGLTKKEIVSVLDGLGDVIHSHIKKNAVGYFTLPGLLKVKTIRKKATKARKGINPFSGEETMFKAKPAHTVVKILPLKKLKDMVS